MADPLDYFPRDMAAPLSHLYAATLDDANDLPSSCRAIYVGTTGNLKVTTRGDTVVTLTGLAVGWHPIRAKRLWATGTTASNIVYGW